MKDHPKVWDEMRGPLEQAMGVMFRLAVCPDGTSYVSTVGGGLVSISGAGQELSDDFKSAQWRGIAATACDSRGRFYTASETLKIYQPARPGKLKLASTSKLAKRVTRLVVTPEGQIYALAQDEGGHPIEWLTPDGKVHRSFGKAADRPMLFGKSDTLLWDQSRRRLVYLSHQTRRSFQLFDAQGRSLGAVATDAPGVERASLIDQLPRFLPTQQLSLVRMPSGEFVLQSSEGIPGINVEGYGDLRLYDGALEPITVGISTKNFGELEGVSDDGGLYFLRPSENGIDVVKAKLEKVG